MSIRCCEFCIIFPNDRLVCPDCTSKLSLGWTHPNLLYFFGWWIKKKPSEFKENIYDSWRKPTNIWQSTRNTCVYTIQLLGIWYYLATMVWWKISALKCFEAPYCSSSGCWCSFWSLLYLCQAVHGDLGSAQFWWKTTLKDLYAKSLLKSYQTPIRYEFISTRRNPQQTQKSQKTDA